MKLYFFFLHALTFAVYYLYSANADSLKHSKYVYDRKNVSSFPSSGFISVKRRVDGKFLNMNVLKQVDAVPWCHTIEFTNTPLPNHSPLVGNSEFVIVDGERFNDHFVWYNGHEFLSYVPTDREYGNWLVGGEPGVDSGYIYFPTLRASATPIDINTPNTFWSWLQHGAWTEQPMMRAVCKDAYRPGSKYFEVEFFDQDSLEHHVSRIIPDVNPWLLEEPRGRSDAAVRVVIDEEEQYRAQAAYYHPGTNSWVAISEVQLLAAVGHPVVISETGMGFISALGINVGTTSFLVGNEHAGNGGWRLFFQKYNSTQAPHRYINVKKEESDEYLIELGPNGFSSFYSVSLPAAHAVHEYKQTVLSELSHVNIGDYVVLWYSFSKNSPTGETQYEQLLVQCIAKQNSSLLYRYYPTDRVKQMRQKVISHLVDVLHMNFFEAPGSGSLFVEASLFGHPIDVHSATFIGNDVYGFIYRYLITKEGKPNGMSSCYFYHAAVSLPQALLYAAEIMCVLIGAKPLTLIQFTSQNEHQWKFPLVRELSRGVIAAKYLYGDSIDLNYQVTRYHEDESLVIYRVGRQYIADGLVPHNASQALHPAPYPDSENPKPDEKMQIFNAWWNGYILGYPEYFVDSYCESFHNSLTQSERRVQMKEAKQSVQSYLRSVGRQQELIRMGLDAPLSAEQMSTILQAASVGGVLGE